MASKKLILFAIVLISFSLTSCFSLAEDITPPPGAELPSPQNTLVPAPAAASDAMVVPATQPDPSAGEPIYTEKCAPCHGEAGMGDGPDAQMLERVPALGSPSLARQASPSEWYTIVTQGNMQKFMPPFSSLTDQQRWDVVAYLYTLSAPPEFVTQGKALFTENCVECHGTDGTEGVVDLTDPAFMSERSAADIFTVLTTGKSRMHEFDQLSEDDRWALTAYVRSFTFANYEPSEIADAPETETEPGDSADPTETVSETPSEETDDTSGFGTVQVAVVTESDAEIPSNLEIVLRGYEEMTEVFTQTMTTVEGNSLAFENVPLPAGRVYFATSEYQNAVFGSDIVTVDEAMTSVDLEVLYFPPTTDPAILNVDRLHVFIDFLSDETLQIYQLYIYSNPTDQVLVPEEGLDTVANFDLPPDAFNFSVQEDMNMVYQSTRTGFGITNIYPSADPYQTLYSFEMAYEDKELDLAIPVGLDAKAVIVMAPSNGVKVESDQLIEGEEQTFEGITYRLYNGSNLTAGENLALTISGRPKGGSEIITTGDDGTNNSLVIGLAGFGITLVAAGIILWRRNQEVDFLDEDDEWLDETEETTEDIMDAIITLDDQYKNGDLPEGAYQSRRKELKDRLKELVIS
jgi:LPXTG-motif cell wall-anchored protein